MPHQFTNTLITSREVPTTSETHLSSGLRVALGRPKLDFILCTAAILHLKVLWQKLWAIPNTLDLIQYNIDYPCLLKLLLIVTQITN